MGNNIDILPFNISDELKELLKDKNIECINASYCRGKFEWEYLDKDTNETFFITQTRDSV